MHQFEICISMMIILANIYCNVSQEVFVEFQSFDAQSSLIKLVLLLSSPFVIDIEIETQISQLLPHMH